jgi:hypothetical protein
VSGFMGFGTQILHKKVILILIFYCTGFFFRLGPWKSKSLKINNSDQCNHDVKKVET